MNSNERWERLRRALANPAQDAAEELLRAEADVMAAKLDRWLELQYAEDQRNDNQRNN